MCYRFPFFRSQGCDPSMYLLCRLHVWSSKGSIVSSSRCLCVWSISTGLLLRVSSHKFPLQRFLLFLDWFGLSAALACLGKPWPSFFSAVLLYMLRIGLPCSVSVLWVWSSVWFGIFHIHYQESLVLILLYLWHTYFSKKYQLAWPLASLHNVAALSSLCWIT